MPQTLHPCAFNFKDVDIRRVAVEEAASVKGARVHFVRFTFDDAWQLSEVEYEAVYRADSLTTSARSIIWRHCNGR